MVDNMALDWSQQKMLDGLAMINKIFGHPNSESEFAASNDTGKTLFFLLADDVVELPEDDLAFLAVLQVAVNESKVDITRPDKVDVGVLEQAFIKAKEDFLGFLNKEYGISDLGLIP